jgi:thiol-disulfide isomerase/thioredoxin
MRFGLPLLLVLTVALSACLPGNGNMAVGSQAPSLRTKTLADVNGDFSRITSYRYPDARMYQYSLDDALATGKPVVLEFATPGHCTVCDNQLQMLKAALNKYQDQVIFLHMDQYQNPEAFKAFKVIGDPWTFIIDGERTVRFKRAGRILYNEMEMALEDVVQGAGAS